ncbi:MAG: hypothetical protein AUI83_22660 [Armatimonadetes bacterium 13_1_40CM_3_65_7]|nr:MAG: hypothetical protein AUI83_22660 [Armatimonadetes bacterium 13_1_40CM_3_65_7]
MGRGIVRGTTVLIYETDDSSFADSAIEALEQAGIDCYRTGGSLNVPYSDSTVCIHIRDAADSQRANEILIKLGAVTDRPDRLPPKWVFAVLAVVVVLLALWIASLEK